MNTYYIPKQVYKHRSGFYNYIYCRFTKQLHRRVQEVLVTFLSCIEIKESFLKFVGNSTYTHSGIGYWKIFLIYSNDTFELGR